MICALHDQFVVHEAAQSDADGGQFGREHFGIADHGGIGGKARRLALDVGLDVFAACLFLAFEQELHVDGELAGGLEQRLHGFDLDVDLPLIVAGAAGVDVVAADFGFKGGRLPLIERVGRLHVIVAVEKDGRLAGRAEPFGIDQGVAIAFNQAGGGHAGGAQLADGEFGGAADVELVLGEGADAGNAEEGLEAFEKIGLMLLEVGHGGIRL